MNKIINDEATDAGNDLVDWFKSQDISPSNGAIIMIKIMATQLVSKTTDKINLMISVSNLSQMLVIEVAEELKRVKDV